MMHKSSLVQETTDYVLMRFNHYAVHLIFKPKHLYIYISMCGWTNMNLQLDCREAWQTHAIFWEKNLKK